MRAGAGRPDADKAGRRRGTAGKAAMPAARGQGRPRPCPRSRGMAAHRRDGRAAGPVRRSGRRARSTAAKRRYMDFRRGIIRAGKYSAGARYIHWGSGGGRRVKPRPEEAGGGAGRVGTADDAGRGERREHEGGVYSRTPTARRPPHGVGRRTARHATTEAGGRQGLYPAAAAPLERSAGGVRGGGRVRERTGTARGASKGACARARVVAGWTRPDAWPGRG